jgi:chromate reductase
VGTTARPPRAGSWRSRRSASEGLYIQFKPGLSTGSGEVTDENVARFLRDYMEEFRTFIVRVLTVLPRPA